MQDAIGERPDATLKGAGEELLAALAQRAKDVIDLAAAEARLAALSGLAMLVLVMVAAAALVVAWVLLVACILYVFWRAQMGWVVPALIFALAHAGLAFEVTIAGDEVEHGKPAPDMFLRAAERLALPPEACVVVEDSPPGVAAGLAAGMQTLGVQRVPETDLSAATRVVDRVSVSAILALANQ